MQEIYEYIVGVLLAISSGIINQVGTVLQKFCVNKLKREEQFGRKLVKEPLWVLGLILKFAISSIIVMFAMYFIGPTLVPGLVDAGLVVLAIFSVKLLNEKLNTGEIIGILMIVFSTITLSFSGMEIDVSSYNLLEFNFLIRVSIFMITISFIGWVFYFFQLKYNRFKGLIWTNVSGIGFVISNLFLAILMGLIGNIFSFSSLGELILFVITCAALILSNILGILALQVAFKYGQASNLVPVQQLTIQIAPIFYYFFIFLLPIPNIHSVLLLISGTILIIGASFILARRETEIDEISLS